MAFNYGQRPETIKIVTETHDDDPKVMRNFIRPINCMATGDTIVWEDAGDQTTTYKVLRSLWEGEKDRHDNGFRQRVFSKHITIFDLEADDPDMPHCVAKVTYDNFMEKETIELFPISMLEDLKESKKKVRESKVRAGGEDLPRDYNPTTAEPDLEEYVRAMFNKVLKESLPDLRVSDRFGKDACGCLITPEYWYVTAYVYSSGYSISIINDAGKVDYRWEGSTKEEFDTDLKDVYNTLKQILKVEYDHMERNPEFRNYESHLKTKHIKESIVEDGIASFLKWLREENFITPIEERDFMKYLKRGDIEEQDVDIIYDIGTDYDPDHESNENFEKCADIIKSYVDQSGLQYCSKKTDKARRVQEGYHGHTFKINWGMLDQEGSDRLTDLLIDAVAWKNEDEDYQTQERFELTFNRKFEELKKRGMSSNEAAPKASNYALFTIFPRDDEEASDIINDYLFSGACRDEEDENLLRSFVSDEGEESKPDQGLPTDKYDLGPWTDPAYESTKRSKKGIKEMARVSDFDLSPYDLRNQIKSYVRGRLYDLIGPDGAANFKINQPKWDMVYNGAQGGTCFAIRTQGEDYYMSTFINSSLNWQGKGFEEFKEDFEDMVNTAFGKTQIRESVTKDEHHCFRVFNMHPDVEEKLESLAEEEPDWLVQFTPKDKNYFLLTTNEVKSKDQLRDLIDVEASYQAQMLF